MIREFFNTLSYEETSDMLSRNVGFPLVSRP